MNETDERFILALELIGESLARQASSGEDMVALQKENVETQKQLAKTSATLEKALGDKK